jgi:pimeloyl-ACP methyl ester carboxylesterase
VTAPRVVVEHHTVDNGAGHTLGLRRTRASDVAPPSARGTRPVLIIPGYGMNSFIFGFHPTGASLEAHLATRGLDVWSCDLRGQGASRRAAATTAKDFGFYDLAVVDLAAVIDALLARAPNDGRVDLIGCSLGASLAFAHLAHRPHAPVGSIVAMGGVVTWTKAHPALRAAFFSPWLVGSVRLRGTRTLAGYALPAIARHAPKLLSIYLNVASTDLSRGDEMVQTVEDPHPTMNRQIAHWLAARELIVRGVNVSRALASMGHPFLCVLANQDGIVPKETARAVYDAIGSPDKALLEVGDRTHPMAHGDLFLANGAGERVFDPIADFLLERQRPAPPPSSS